MIEKLNPAHPVDVYATLGDDGRATLSERPPVVSRIAGCRRRGLYPVPRSWLWVHGQPMAVLERLLGALPPVCQPVPCRLHLRPSRPDESPLDGPRVFPVHVTVTGGKAVISNLPPDCWQSKTCGTVPLRRRGSWLWIPGQCLEGVRYLTGRVPRPWEPMRCSLRLQPRNGD